jgi:hypothetical protein
MEGGLDAWEAANYPTIPTPHNLSKIVNLNQKSNLTNMVFLGFSASFSKNCTFAEW